MIWKDIRIPRPAPAIPNAPTLIPPTYPSSLPRAPLHTHTHNHTHTHTHRYGINLDCEAPAHLHLTGMETGGRLEKVLTRYCEGFENYIVSKAAAPHADHFAKERLVYLTPDSPTPLLELDPDKVCV